MCCEKATCFVLHALLSFSKHSFSSAEDYNAETNKYLNDTYQWELTCASFNKFMTPDRPLKVPTVTARFAGSALNCSPDD